VHRYRSGKRAAAVAIAAAAAAAMAKERKKRETRVESRASYYGQSCGL